MHEKIRRINVIYCSARYFEDSTITVVNELAMLCDVELIMSYGQPDPAHPEPNTSMRAIGKQVKTFFVFRKGRIRNPAHIVYDFRVLLHILRKRPDVLFVEAIDSAYFTPYFLLLRLLGIPVVQALHDVVPHSGSENSLDRRLQRLRIAWATTLVVYSENQLAVLQKNFGRTAATLRLPTKSYYADIRNGPIPNREPFTILFFGTVRPNKGLEILIQAAELARAEVPDLRVIVAGACNNFSPYQKFIQTPELFELHLQRVADQDVGNYFLRSRLLVLPYHDATQSGPALLAYEFHCPVLATNVGGLPEYIRDGETGVLIPPNDPAALARAIVELMHDPSRLDTMGEAGNNFINENSSPKKIAQELFAFLQQTAIKAR